MIYSVQVVIKQRMNIKELTAIVTSVMLTRISTSSGLLTVHSAIMKEPGAQHSLTTVKQVIHSLDNTAGQNVRTVIKTGHTGIQNQHV